MNKIIARGAEAVILQEKKSVIKHRVPKGYRYPALDETLRTLRTRAEARILEKAAQIISVPRLITINESEKKLELEYIKGKKLADHFDKLKNASSIAKQIGISLAKLHDANIMHGDLTTSNMIYHKKLYFIDFGLAFHSTRVEDKAVDIHVFKEALEAKHPLKHLVLYKAFLTGYKTSKLSSAVLKQLEKVEKRGRYKSQY